MTREWNPGDVAMVVNVAKENKVARFTGNCGKVSKPHWSFADGSFLLSREVTEARPLVVIDPESAVDAERLVEAWLAHFYNPEDESTHLRKPDAMQAALREFANPTPPKPDEPMGLGAVVEDASGRKWVRVGSNLDGLPRPWAEYGNIGDSSYWVSYAVIAAVRVLSEGVIKP